MKQELEEGLLSIQEDINEILSNLSGVEYYEDLPQCIVSRSLEVIGEIMNRISPLSNDLYKVLRSYRSAEDRLE